MTDELLSDERLCWLAVRDYIQGRTKPSLLLRIVGAMNRGAETDIANDLSSGQQADYAFAVDDVSRKLTPEERQILRQTGQVPAWFLPEVERQYEQVRQR